MKKSNIELDQMLSALEPLLDRKGVLGMVVANNVRTIRDTIQEFTAKKEELIRKYGTDNGSGTIYLDPGSPNLHQFLDELEPYSAVMHDVKFVTVPVRDVMNDLSGREILTLDFMLEDDA